VNFQVAQVERPDIVELARRHALPELVHLNRLASRNETSLPSSGKLNRAMNNLDQEDPHVHGTFELHDLCVFGLAGLVATR